MKFVFLMALMFGLSGATAQAQGKKLDYVKYDCQWTWLDFNSAQPDFHEKKFELVASPKNEVAKIYSAKSAELGNADVMIQIANVFEDFNSESVVNLDLSYRTVNNGTSKSVFGAASFFSPLQKEALVSLQLEGITHEVRCKVNEVKYTN